MHVLIAELVRSISESNFGAHGVDAVVVETLVADFTTMVVAGLYDKADDCVVPREWRLKAREARIRLSCHDLSLFNECFEANYFNAMRRVRRNEYSMDVAVQKLANEKTI
jgi:hypothetical protein